MGIRVWRKLSIRTRPGRYRPSVWVMGIRTNAGDDSRRLQRRHVCVRGGFGHRAPPPGSAADRNTAGPADWHATRAADRNTAGPADCDATRAADRNTAGPADCDATRAADRNTAGPADCDATRAADRNTAGPADCDATRAAGRNIA